MPPAVDIFQAPFREGAEGSRALLLRCAARYAGRPVRDLGPVETGPWGKPFFPRTPQVRFSITHSGGWWLCAFSAQEVGLDLQIHRSHVPPAVLSSRFFHPEEDAFLARGGYRDFFPLWAAKESWVKFTGRGFYHDPGDFSLVSSAGDFPAMEGAQLRPLPFCPGYSLCLCAGELGEIRRIAL